MITLDNIIEWAKPHPIKEGKVTRISNNAITVSIVGGVSGLYGDFIKDFEFAILDNLTGNFVTKLYYTDTTDEVVGYFEGEKLVKFLNMIFIKGFQVQ